jgi:hypothetical protein
MVEKVEIRVRIARSDLEQLPPDDDGTSPIVVIRGYIEAIEFCDPHLALRAFRGDCDALIEVLTYLAEEEARR